MSCTIDNGMVHRAQQMFADNTKGIVIRESLVRDMLEVALNGVKQPTIEIKGTYEELDRAITGMHVATNANGNAFRKLLPNERKAIIGLLTSFCTKPRDIQSNESIARAAMEKAKIDDDRRRSQDAQKSLQAFWERDALGAGI